MKTTNLDKINLISKITVLGTFAVSGVALAWSSIELRRIEKHREKMIKKIRADLDKPIDLP